MKTISFTAKCPNTGGTEQAVKIFITPLAKDNLQEDCTNMLEQAKDAYIAGILYANDHIRVVKHKIEGCKQSVEMDYKGFAEFLEMPLENLVDRIVETGLE